MFPSFFYNSFKALASFAQIRIYLDERIRLTNQDELAIYNLVFPLEVVNNSYVSLKCLHHALCSIINKHTILRTQILFHDNKENISLYQTILESIEFPFQISTLMNNNQSLEDILENEETNPFLFNIEKGLVFRCHIIRRNQSIIDSDLLLSGDIIIFNFHHIAFDGTSTDIFFHDLALAYANKDIGILTLNYIDYSIYDRIKDLKESKQLWNDQFKDYTIHLLQLPYNKLPNQIQTRSNKGFKLTFTVNNDVVDQLLNYTIQHDITFFHFGLAMFYSFLYKLTGDKDLCIATVFENRVRSEVSNMIGFFVNTIPYRFIINPQESFHNMVQRIKTLSLLLLSHSHLPYQDIISNHSTIQTLFTIENGDTNEILKLDDSTLMQPLIRLEKERITTIFDFECSIIYSSKNHSMNISLQGSLDLFNEETIESMNRRLQCLFHQLFIVPTIFELSILLSNEIQLINDLNNTYVNYGEIGCIHWNIASQAEKYPQKIALILENGSMTYAELLYYSQYVASYLINEYNIKPSEIICQLIERSFEMIIGMISILMCGAIYTALSSREPLTRLLTCIQQTNARLILIHHATNHIPLINYSLLDINKVISFARVDDDNISLLNSVNMTPEYISHIVFTSGSTGIPKAVRINKTFE